MKSIIVCGGVISGTGKGIAAASIGLLLKLRGQSVQLIKFDPYLNINAGILAPREHGECFLCDDGTETDLDLGHYERIVGTTVSKDNICTSGTIYKELIEEQEDGKYLGDTIQVIPHVTDKIQNRLYNLGKTSDIVIAEIGGTVGDTESGQFYHAIANFKQRNWDDCIIAMVAPILWIPTIKEFKTKPLQAAVKGLQSFGIQPEMLLCRVDRPVPDNILNKVANLTNVPREAVFDAPDVSTIYKVPIEFYNRHIDDFVADKFRIKRTGCRIHKYRDLVEKHAEVTSCDESDTHVCIGIVGKYENCDEAYISLKDALYHASVANDIKVDIKWINAETLENYKDMRGFNNHFGDVDGVIVPGGFDARGIEGKIKATKYCREKKIPFLGICLGLQCAVIEYARLMGAETANSQEFDPDTEFPVVHLMEEQKAVKKKSATMRLGAYDCALAKDSLAHELYKKKNISERHRHRYEVNADLVNEFPDFNISGLNPQRNLVEIMELKREVHPYFIGTQAHPEFKSRLDKPAPLFNGLVKAAIQKRREG